MVDSLTGEFRPFSEHVRSGLELAVARENLEPFWHPPSSGPPRSRSIPTPPRQSIAWPRAATARGADQLGVDAGRATLAAAGLADRFEQILGVDAVGAFKPHRSVNREGLPFPATGRAPD